MAQEKFAVRTSNPVQATLFTLFWIIIFFFAFGQEG
jgi:hypothetical protein